MYALGSLLVSIVQVLSMIITVYQYVIIGVVLISWVSPDPHNPIVRFLRQATEPIFYQVRRIMPRALFRTGLDFTPLIVLLLLSLFKNFVLGQIYIYGQRLMGPR